MCGVAMGGGVEGGSMHRWSDQATLSGYQIKGEGALYDPEEEALR